MKKVRELEREQNNKMRTIVRSICAVFLLPLVLFLAGAFLAMFVTAAQVKHNPSLSNEANDRTGAADGRLVGGPVDVKAFGAKAAPIPTTQCPAMLAYIANLDSNDVSVIDTSNDTVLATVPVGNSPFGVAVKPDGTRVYVTNDSDNTVSVIDTFNNTVVATPTTLSQ